MTEPRTPADDASNDTASGGLAEFETAVAELESIVATLESGEVDLEQALTQFERGVALTRQCQRTLNNAELRVDQLLGADDESATPEVAEFDATSDDESGGDVTGGP